MDEIQIGFFLSHYFIKSLYNNLFQCRFRFRSFFIRFLCVWICINPLYSLCVYIVYSCMYR